MEQRDPERPEGRDPSRLEARQTLIERQIQAAIDEGRFANLPYQGERLPLEDDSAAGDWAMAYRLMRDHGVVPDWIDAARTAADLDGRIETLIARASRVGPLAQPRLRAELDGYIEALETAILRLEHGAPTDAQRRARPDAQALRARLEAAFRS